MTNSQTSPNYYARIGGLAYLFIIIAGATGELFIRNTLLVQGNAAATANNIAASPLLWRIGIVGDLLMHVCDLIVAIVYYKLLRPVNKDLALLAVFFGLIQTAVLVANKMNMMMPLLLENADYLKAFTPEQLQAWAYLSVKAHGYGFGIGLIFFGFECLIDGYLIFKTGYLPKVLGVMIQIAGVCYLINSFAAILAPKLANQISPAILLPPFVGELSICLWLIFKGVNLVKWNERVTENH
jgi:hypothetical protein